MNIIASIFALAILGTETTQQANIVPEGLDYQAYLEITFHEETIYDMNALTDSQDEVIVYNAEGDVVGQGAVNFIGSIVDTDDQALYQMVNRANYLMELGNTRIYRLD